jgi:transcriptional regulator with XRE-family HTH domain
MPERPERRVDPNACRRRLKVELRQLREANSLTQLTVATRMEWSLSKVIRIETGEVTISPNDLAPLLRLYEVQDEKRREYLIDLARQARQDRQARRRSWLNQYKDLASKPYLSYLSYEENAVRSYNFQPTLIPGMLQTEEYALDIMNVIIGAPRRRVEGLVDLRMARQEKELARSDIQWYFLMDESVARRVVGNAGIMTRQIQHAMDLNQRSNITVEIVPFHAGFYRGLRLPFVVFEFPDPSDEAVLYLEDPHGEAIIREDAPIQVIGADPPSGEEGIDSGSAVPPTYLGIFLELRQKTSAEVTSRIFESALRELGD